MINSDMEGGQKESCDPKIIKNTLEHWTSYAKNTSYSGRASKSWPDVFTSPYPIYNPPLHLHSKKTFCLQQRDCISKARNLNELIS